MLSERAIHDIFTRRGLTLAVAESCAGGLISHRITNIPGSSAYFKGGIVAYSNDVKAKALKVPRGLMEKHGAVSAAVAEAMAVGAKKAMAADVAVSVTGIAGPSGGTKTKPVGLAFIAVAYKGRVASRKVRFTGSRLELKKKFADAALGLLISKMRPNRRRA